MDVESKLALVKQLRQEQKENYRQMNHRTQILYGKNDGDYTQEDVIVSNSYSSFGIRFLMAVFLFFLFFFMDTQNIHVGECNSQQIVQSISENVSLTDFMEFDIVSRFDLQY